MLIISTIIEIDVDAITNEIDSEAATDIIFAIVDINDLANDDSDEITLQNDMRFVLSSDDSDELTGGDIEGLPDCSLEVIKSILGVHRCGNTEHLANISTSSESETVYKTKIPTIVYVEYERHGDSYGSSTEVYLRYEDPDPSIVGVSSRINVEVTYNPILDASFIVSEVIRSILGRGGVCSDSDIASLRDANAMLIKLQG